MHELEKFRLDFKDFFEEFDKEMDYLANKASFDNYKQEMNEIESEIKKPSQFFMCSSFKYPTFGHVQADTDWVANLGRITDNSDFSMPLVAFNTYSLELFNYSEKVREFVQLKVSGDEYMEIRKSDIPKYFKSLYLPILNQFLIVGGLDKQNLLSSPKSYLIDERGKLIECNEMQIGRQYQTMCLFTKEPTTNDEICGADFDVYSISGYNSDQGLLPSAEKYNCLKRSWSKVEATLNTPRINGSATQHQNKYIYLFGGLSTTLIDSIERLNTHLNVWTLLKIKMPSKVSNLFAFSINEQNIVILGGLKRKEDKFVPKDSKQVFELENRVFVFKTQSLKWKELKSFPFQKKISQIEYNNHGKFYC